MPKPIGPADLPNASVIPDALIAEHRGDVPDALERQHLDALLVFAPSNLRAFIGTPLQPSDRLVCGLIDRTGRVALICPAFEAPTDRELVDGVTVFAWPEHADPYATVAAALRSLGVDRGTVAVDDFMWIGALERLREAVDGITLKRDPGIIEAIRIVKSPAELEAIERAVKVTGSVYDVLPGLIRAGVSEADLLWGANHEMRKRGHPTGQGLFQFGPNAAVPHRPSGSRRLQDGDLIVCDFVVQVGGYFGDLTRTYALGTPSDRARRAYDAVRRARRAAIQALRPDVTCESVDAAARRVIEAAGFGDCFVHRLGHGIGLDIHEPPYLVEGSRRALEAGMVVTVEPGVYIPGQFGVRIEDVVAITPDGCRVLSASVPTDVSTAFV